MNSFEYYQELRNRHPRLSREEEEAIIERCCHSEGAPRDAAIRELVLHNLFIPLNQTLSFTSVQRSNAEECLSAAVGGLFQAADRVQIGPTPFYCYAVKRVRGAILDYFRRAPSVVIPRGEMARRRESLEAAGIEARPVSAQLVSFDAVLGRDDGEATLHEFMADTESFGASPRPGDFREVIAIGLNQLSPREREILILRFGLNGGREHTLEEIGDRFGVGLTRIHYIIKKALATMRKRVEAAA